VSSACAGVLPSTFEKPPVLTSRRFEHFQRDIAVPHGAAPVQELFEAAPDSLHFAGFEPLLETRNSCRNRRIATRKS
jgi:hypothetical protein